MRKIFEIIRITQSILVAWPIYQDIRLLQRCCLVLCYPGFVPKIAYKNKQTHRLRTAGDPMSSPTLSAQVRQKRIWKHRHCWWWARTFRLAAFNASKDLYRATRWNWTSVFCALVQIQSTIPFSRILQMYFKKMIYLWVNGFL